MRILRLDLGSSIGTLDLHPFVTIVSELTREQGDTMAESIRSLVSGNSQGLFGLVENDGELIELGGSSDDRIGVLTLEDIIVPLHELGDGEVPLIALEAELDQLSRAADLDMVHVEQVRVGLNPTSAAEVFRIKELLGGNLLAGVSERKVSQAEHLRSLLADSDRIPATIGKIPPEVVEVSALWDGYREEERQAKRHLDLLRGAVAEAEVALGDSMHNKVRAEEAAVPLLLSAADDRRLEELVNPDNGKRRKKNKLAAQEAVDSEIKAILTSVGMTSYTAYVMHRVTPEPPAEMVERLEVAKVQIDKAEAALQEAKAELELDPVASGLRANLTRVKEAARDYLGPVLPDDIGSVLAEIVDYEINPAWVESVSIVRQTMIKAQIPFDPDSDETQICALASDWITGVDREVEAAEKIDPEVLQVKLIDAEERFTHHVKAMSRMDRLESKAESSCRARDDLRDQIGRMKSGDGSRADHILARLSMIVDRVVGTSKTAIPMICWGELDDLLEDDLVVLLDGLEVLSAKAQIVYVADSGRIKDWVAQAGLRRAMCSSVSRVAI